MSFTANVCVTKCEQCPYKQEQVEKAVTFFICTRIKNEPVIEYNGILSKCPYNKNTINVPSISDYVKGRNSED